MCVLRKIVKRKEKKFYKRYEYIPDKLIIKPFPPKKLNKNNQKIIIKDIYICIKKI